MRTLAAILATIALVSGCPAEPGTVPDAPLYLGVTAASSSTTDTNIFWLTDAGGVSTVPGRCP